MFGRVRMKMEQISRWVFLAFVVIAIMMGLMVGYMAYSADLHWNDPRVADSNGAVTLIMLILGIIVGVTSITGKEVTPFLIATIALIVATVTDVWSPLARIHEVLYYWATGILNYVVAFASPVAVIIAVNAVFAMTKEK